MQLRNERANRNVGAAERIASVAAGAALIARSTRHRDGLGIAGAFAGVALIVRGASGQCPVYRSLGVNADGGAMGHGDDSLRATHASRNNSSRRASVTSRAATVNARKARRVERTVMIQQDRQLMYEFWRDFTNLPQFMEHLVSVDVKSPTQSHWTVKGPAGTTVEWNAEIVNDVPGALIAWKSIGNATVPNAGSVKFSDAAAGRGTIIKVELEYEPPVRFLGAGVAALFGENPDRQVREDLRKFKQLMETGQITTNARRVKDDAVRSFTSTPELQEA